MVGVGTLIKSDLVLTCAHLVRFRFKKSDTKRETAEEVNFLYEGENIKAKFAYP